MYIIIEREREAIVVGEVQSCHSGIVISDDESAKIVVMIMMAQKFCCIASSKSKTPSVHIKIAGSGCDPQMYDTLIGFDPLLSATRSRTPRRAAEHGRIVAVHCWK